MTISAARASCVSRKRLPVDCTKCDTALPEAWFTGTGGGACPACGSTYQVLTFPAMAVRQAALSTADLAISEGEASCFQHEKKKAVSSCHQCGRFLCALCQMESDGQVWCPNCLVSGISTHKFTVLENRRTLYDSIALGMAALPLCVFYMAVFTGPVAVFLAIRFWNRPSSLIPRTKWRLAVALLLGILETAGLVALILFLTWGLRQRQYD